jgi:zinc protease
LQIVVLRDRLAPVVTTWLNVEAGSDDEPITGIAHAQEHMFYRGSRTLSGAAADEIAGFTGDQDNADTQSEITQFYHLVPSADLDLALQLDRARFHGILDAQRDWNEERGAIEQEVTRDNSDANYRLYVKLLHHMHGRHAVRGRRARHAREFRQADQRAAAERVLRPGIIRTTRST